MSNPTASGKEAISDTLKKLKIGASSPEQNNTKPDDFLRATGSTPDKKYIKEELPGLTSARFILTPNTA